MTLFDYVNENPWWTLLLLWCSFLGVEYCVLAYVIKRRGGK